jgi:peptidoglycan hydrolase CwlO-like protein
MLATSLPPSKHTHNHRLEELDALARKLNSECDSLTPVVDELEKKVSELEATSSGMSSDEVAKVTSDITQGMQV